MISDPFFLDNHTENNNNSKLLTSSEGNEVQLLLNSFYKKVIIDKRPIEIINGPNLNSTNYVNIQFIFRYI